MTRERQLGRTSQRQKGKSRRQASRRAWWTSPWTLVGSAAGLALIVIGLLVWSNLQVEQPSLPSAAATRQVVDQTTHVSSQVLNAAPATSLGLQPANPPTTLQGTGGRAEVLYIGGEFCPFCAAERWSLVVALSRFGTFSGLALTTSSENPPLPTFTFRNATFNSPVVTFTSVEAYDRDRNPLQPLTPADSQLQAKYGAANAVPFILIGGRYVAQTSGYPPSTLENQDWQQIAGNLGNSSAPTTQAIVGEANMLSAAICRVDNGRPGSVCQSPAVTRALPRLGGT
jgi:Domain of unknown function (DUF929)